ncbi:DUF5067 domain-containing protein [Dermabacter hominis]|uniref:DUF5067 domain-containing protein n=1 Tax=Dermabacter hominis TaxID=36740 RepID=UPI0012E90AE1|nr:DUF5067 domain-containing protein [Dermabacter hominis]MCT1955021.1 DUF5067 domain-containing protein [Dermabacter hominis]MCT2025457.1 DUF5067 domain-containing protein [Dermabacter hominis]MDU1123147.1 DUF5067 domain-containing protein [Dermabacter sp.]
MKKTVLSILAVCSLVSLTGCGAVVSTAHSDQPSSQSSASEAATAAETTPAATAAAAQATETSEPAPTSTPKTIAPAPASTAEAAPVEAEKPTEPAVEEEPADPYALEIGKEVQVGAYSVTVTKLKIVNDWEGNKVLKVTYDWKNNSGEATYPSLSVLFRGFQDGVETDWSYTSDHIDPSNSVKEAKPGASITGVEGGIGIADMSKPLVIELEDSFSFDNQTYTMTIDDLNAL